MDSIINQIVFLIKQLVDAEKEYMIDGDLFPEINRDDALNTRVVFCRQKLLDTIARVKLDYNNIIITNPSSEIKFYQLFLCKKLESIKQIILFEDSVIFKINEEIHLFYKKVNKIFYKPYEEDLYNSEDSMNSLISNTTKNKRLNYPNKVVRVLKGWLERNILDPYPSEDQKEEFCEKTGLEMNQINNWFINARRRILPQLKRNYEKYM